MSLPMDSRKNRSSSTTETKCFFIAPPSGSSLEPAVRAANKAVAPPGIMRSVSRMPPAQCRCSVNFGLSCGENCAGWAKAGRGAESGTLHRACPQTRVPPPPHSNSGASVKGVVLGQGDCLLDESKVLVEQFLGLGTGCDRRSAIHRRHRNLYGHEGASHIGSVLGEGHRRG